MVLAWLDKYSTSFGANIQIEGKARLPIAVEKSKPLSKGNFENQPVLRCMAKKQYFLKYQIFEVYRNCTCNIFCFQI